jgi:hypothetical protein
MDMAMMGLMGTVVGASAVGIAGVAKSTADTVLPRMMGNIDHKHQMTMHLHGQRCEAIHGWRVGLAATVIRRMWWATRGLRAYGRTCRPPAKQRNSAPLTRSTATIRRSPCSLSRSGGSKPNGPKRRKAAGGGVATGPTDA